MLLGDVLLVVFRQYCIITSSFHNDVQDEPPKMADEAKIPCFLELKSLILFSFVSKLLLG